MTRIRTLLCLLLALAVMATSVTSAVARSEMAGSTELVICSTDGTARITLDAGGKPVAHAHPCPHCLSAALAFLPPAPVQVLRPATRARSLGALPVLHPVSRETGAARARGPPLSV